LFEEEWQHTGQVFGGPIGNWFHPKISEKFAQTLDLKSNEISGGRHQPESGSHDWIHRQRVRALPL